MRSRLILRWNLRSYASEPIEPDWGSPGPHPFGESVLKALLLGAMFLNVVFPVAASAQTPDSPEIAACKATGLLALKEKSPSVVDLVLDMDTLIVSKANTDIEGTPVRTVVMGDAYLEKKGTGKAQHFLCLIGDKGKVLLTFFAVP
jgi:hypothetical protein